MKSKKQQFIAIITTGVLILGFAITIYVLKTPPDLGPNANLADRVFDFLDQWASAGAPAILLLAILASLYIGIKSLRHTENIQKQEQRYRLLNEIIEWAEGLTSCHYSLKRQESNVAGNLLQKHRYYASKQTYIKKSVEFFENRELSCALSNILDDKGSLQKLIVGLSEIDRIDIHVEGKEKLKDSETNPSKLATLALEQAELSVTAASKWIYLEPIGQKLYEDVTDLIEKASDIKMKLISEF